MSNALLILGGLVLIASYVARRRAPRLVRPFTYGAGALILAALVWALADGGWDDVQRGFDEYEAGSSASGDGSDG